MATVIDPNHTFYSLEMFLQFYARASLVACTLVVLVGGLNYARRS